MENEKKNTGNRETELEFPLRKKETANKSKRERKAKKKRKKKIKETNER